MRLYAVSRSHRTSRASRAPPTARFAFQARNRGRATSSVARRLASSPSRAGRTSASRASATTRASASGSPAASCRASPSWPRGSLGYRSSRRPSSAARSLGVGLGSFAPSPARTRNLLWLERARGRTVRELVVEIRRGSSADDPFALDDESDATDGEPRDAVLDPCASARRVSLAPRARARAPHARLAGAGLASGRSDGCRSELGDSDRAWAGRSCADRARG